MGNSIVVLIHLKIQVELKLFTRVLELLYL